MKKIRIPLLILLTLICLLLGIGIGSVMIPAGDMLTILAARLTGAQLPERIAPVTASIFWSIRMPRACMAFLTGAALSVSGAVMQSMLRNPLASSYTLGVSSGASLAAALVMLTGFSIPWLGDSTLAFCGFAGGLACVLGAIALSTRFDPNLSSATVVLTGMVLSLFVNACLTMVTTFSGDHLKQLIFWQMGSFSGQDWRHCAVLAAVLLLCLPVLIRRGAEMDLMTFGEEQAMSAGVELKRVKRLMLLLCALLTGTAVSFAGVIGFIDLITPHAARKLFGSRHRVLIPMCALLGGGFMVLADLLARTVVSPRELPAGAVTALIGAPFFAYVYFHRKRK